MTATIFPNKPVGSVPPTVHKTFEFLKTLPDGCKVWHHLALWQDEAPDFLILNPNNHAIIIKVCSATSKQFRSRIQMLLMGEKDEKTGENETAILEKFIHKFHDHLSNSQDSVNLVKCGVLFPNIETRQVVRSKPSIKSIDLIWLGKEYLDSSRIEQWQALFPTQSLDEVSCQKIREMFTPESIVPNTLTVRQQTDRNLKAGLEDFLLDYDQEKVLKHDLELPEENRHLTRDFQISLLNGVAGSGKTLILLYRLRLLFELYPTKKILVLTHNRALIRDIQFKYYRLCGDLPNSIEWKTFYQWLKHHWPVEQFLNPIGRNRKEEIIQKIKLDIFPNATITTGMLLSEIDWINDQVDRSREGYLATERRGRGFRLSQNQRNLMYDAYEKYLGELRKIKRIDWGLVPHAYMKYINEGMGSIPQYDGVLIDESQFFAPIWYEIIRNMIKPQTGNIFIVADPTQGFLNRGVSWRSMGIEVRGRSYELKRSYRTTKEIMTLATVFYRQRVPQDTADEGVLEPEILHMPDGVVTDFIQLQNYQDEIARVTNQVEQFVNQFAIPKSQILIIHADWQGAERLINIINRRLGPNSAKDPRNHDPGDYIRVTNLNRGTGIESPIVFFVGMHLLMEKEQSLRISDEEREKLMLENTRKIYMAMTRAGQRLVITYAGQLPNDIQWMFQ